MKKNSIFLLLLLFSFITLATSCSSKSDNTVKDKDGNVYHTIKIGNQIWMVENLKTTKYNDGTAIPLIADNTAWSHLSTPGYCWYNNNKIAYKNSYGALYNWYTINTGKLAPIGWHVATLTDWENLEKYIKTKLEKSGSTAKALASTTNWTNDTIPGSIGYELLKNNNSGFTAIPGGYRGNHGGFHDFGSTGSWWPFNEESGMVGAWYLSLYSKSAGHLCKYCTYRRSGFSVRCVKNPE